ncbi:MAG TPA: hypothetical protein VGQ83_20260 [Polyangia bacterium]|jgi:hypothetical protein
MHHSPWFALSLLVPMLLLPSCDDDSGPTAITTAQVSMACTGPDDDPVNDTAAVSRVDQCNYWRGNQGFHLRLIAPQPASGPDYNEINIGIANLAGPGTYTTDPAGTTEVYVVGGTGFGADSSGDVPGDDSPAFPCTLAVDTNLHAVQIPSGSSTTGWISLDVTCERLGVAQVGRMTCEMSPTSFKVVIVGCEATY